MKELMGAGLLLHDSAEVATADDQRAVPRTPVYRTHCLTVTTETDFLVGFLVDHSSEGLGVRVFKPLPVYSKVLVCGTVQVNGCWKEYSGSAVVAHCQPEDERLFRVGLALDNATWTDIDDPELGARPQRMLEDPGLS